MPIQKKCFLKSMEDNDIKIHLQDKIEIPLGRCPETNIKDKRCSRNQVLLTADYSSEMVNVKHLGGNPSSANGIILRNDSHILKHNDLLEFLIGEYKFIVEFETPLVKPEKRKNEISEENKMSGAKRFCKEEDKSLPLPPPCGKSTWERIEDGKLYIFTSAGVRSSSKIAAYDLDGTLILTKSGRVFPKDNDDWKLAFGSVKPKLSKFAGDGYKIVILTNQAGISRGKTNINEFKTKIENIVRDLNVPVQVFIATTTSIYRKPAPGMWTFLETKIVCWLST
uniref:PNK FHA domain-containing protein n=1 Tax=Graphocephala atropunctata TaxID=36148 RepID=A0A1B6MMI3_9HEMI